MINTGLFRSKLFITARQFAFSSGLATALHWTVLWILILQGVEAVIANAIGALCGAIANYFLQFHLTFERRARHAVASVNYIVSCALGWIVNSLLFAFCVETLAMSVLLAQCLVVVTVAGLNFFIYQYWVFNEQ